MQAVGESVGQLEVGTIEGREQTVGGRDGGDERGTIFVSISDEEEEEMIDGNALEGLLSIVLSRLGSPEKCIRRRWAARQTYQIRCLGVQEKIWIAPKGKPLELMVHSRLLFRVSTETFR